MSALIPELIAMASDPTVKTTELLRKAMVAARLLKQPEFAAWINSELQGYQQSGDLPPYRVLQGELKVDVPGHGRLPLPIRNAEMSCSFVLPPRTESNIDTRAFVARNTGTRLGV